MDCRIHKYRSWFFGVWVGAEDRFRSRGLENGFEQSTALPQVFVFPCEKGLSQTFRFGFEQLHGGGSHASTAINRYDCSVWSVRKALSVDVSRFAEKP